MESLIPLIAKETVSNRWITNEVEEVEQFKYDKVNIWYRVLKWSEDGLSCLIPPNERNSESCPIVARGIVAYLIHNWGRYEEDIFNEYYNLSLSNFEDKEKRKPGAFKRDLKSEHYALHVSEEKEHIKYSDKILSYLPASDQKLIKEYLKSYFDFIKMNYNTPIKSDGRIMPFSYYLQNIDEKDELIEVLKGQYPTARNKEGAIMLVTLYENALLILPKKTINLYRSIGQEWGGEKIGRWGIEKFLKQWWTDINMDWLEKHRAKLVYPAEVLNEIKFLKSKVQEIKSEK